MNTDASAVRANLVREIQSWGLEYAPQRLPLVREMVADQMRRWGLEGRVEDARLVATELVGNVRHTGDKHFRLTMRRRPEAIMIEVRDFSSVLVNFPEPATDLTALGDLRELAEHGRGLSCVRSFADGVGVRPVRNGKIVWAKLRYPHACRP
ncbi:ATP-binding protein [Streptomyces varsoviensis]|nr:ATP-binding protein [Streptomyces varsoviensis]